MKYEIEGNVLQDILNYLAQQKYSEVVNLIAAVQHTARPVVEEEATDG